MNRNIIDRIFGIILLIFCIATILIFCGMMLFLPIAGGTTPSIFDLIMKLFN